MRASQQEFRKQQERFATYLDQVTQVAGHADRVVPMQNYTKGVLLPIERKSVEPMAARLAPDNVRQMHQSLHHIVNSSLGTRRGIIVSCTRLRPTTSSGPRLLVGMVEF